VTFLPIRILALSLAASLSLGALAQVSQSPLSSQSPTPVQAPLDPALGQQLAHCAAVLYGVQQVSASRRLAMHQRDATALMRYTMLASSALLGEQKGLAEVKNQQAQLRSKLGLTREPNIKPLLDAEAASCVELVDTNKEALNQQLVRMPDKP